MQSNHHYNKQPNMAKQKQTRTYDQDGFRKRAACLCVRDPQEHEVLLVTSSRASDHWIVPGGGIEPNEDPRSAAIRETEEEAGVKGTIKRCLGDFEVRNEKMERKHRTSVFVLEVHEELDEWEDSKSRLRRWFHVEEALRLLAIHKPVQCSYLNLLIQTSPPLRQLVPHLLTFDVSRFNSSINSMVFSPSESLSSLPCNCKQPSPTKLLSQANHLHHSSNNNSKLKCNNDNSSDDTSKFYSYVLNSEVYLTDLGAVDAKLNSVANHVNRPELAATSTASVTTVCDSMINSNDECSTSQKLL